MKKYFGYIFDLYFFLIVLILGLIFIGALSVIIWDAIQISSQIFDELYKLFFNFFGGEGQNFIFFMILLPSILYWFLFRRVPSFLKSKIFSYASILIIILLFSLLSYIRLYPVNYVTWNCEPEFKYTDLSKGTLYERNIPVYAGIDVLVNQKEALVYRAPLARQNDPCYFSSFSNNLLKNDTFDLRHSDRYDADDMRLCPIQSAKFSSGFKEYLTDMKKTHEMVNKDTLFLNANADINNKYDFTLEYLFNNYSFDDSFKDIHSMTAKCTLKESVLGKWFGDRRYLKGMYWEYKNYILEK